MRQFRKDAVKSEPENKASFSEATAAACFTHLRLCSQFYCNHTCYKAVTPRECIQYLLTREERDEQVRPDLDFVFHIHRHFKEATNANQ